MPDPPSPPPHQLEVIAGGSTALIHLRPDGTTIQKSAYPDSAGSTYSIRDLAREFTIYQTLPTHPRLLALHPDSSSERLVLRHLPKGCLRTFLSETPVSRATRLQFAADAAEGLSVLHACGVVHGDISSWNFLVDESLRLCIIDFAGSTTEQIAGSALESVRFCLPRSMKDPSTVQTDLFALGSLLYEIESGREPYHDCADDEVERLFRDGEFPSTGHLALGTIIRGCWRSAYETADDVYRDISQVLRSKTYECE